MGVMIPVQDLVGEMRKMLNLRRPEICRHHVCCDLLSILERNGVVLDNELVKAIVAAEDDVALGLLYTLQGNENSESIEENIWKSQK